MEEASQETTGSGKRYLLSTPRKQHVSANEDRIRTSKAVFQSWGLTVALTWHFTEALCYLSLF